MESELKLTTSTAHLHKISSQRLLQDFALSEPVTRRLTSHYFDTPDTVLQQQGLTLRVREDAGHPLQTLKGRYGARVRTGALDRGEWETPLHAGAHAGPAATVPDLRTLRRARQLPRKVARTLRSVDRAGTLAEQFIVQAERTTWPLAVDGAIIDMALDDGAAITSDTKSNFAEIGLALKSGARSALYAAARQLARHIPVQLSVITKAERGYALLDRGPRPRKAGPIALRGQGSVEAGMRTIFLACLAHAQANAEGFLDSDDAEFLHQFRVGMRRFKSALKLFRGLVALPLDLQVRLADLATSLGSVRDADVLARATLPQLAAAAKNSTLLQPLHGAAQAHAAGQRQAARQSMHSLDHAQLMLGLFEWVDGKRWRDGLSKTGRARLRLPLARFAAGAVSEANALVVKRAHKLRRLGGRDSAALHRLRIACKQARYAVEFFTSIARPRRAARAVRRLARLQDALGQLNDLHVAQAAVAELKRAQPDLAAAADVASACLRGMVQARLGQRHVAWRKLTRSHPALRATGIIAPGARG